MNPLATNLAVRKDNNVVFLWCVPRSLSTLLTKCLSFVDGIQVWFEPYVVCYENLTIRNLEFLPDDPKMTLYRERYNLEKLKLAKTITWDDPSTWFEEGNFRYSWVRKQLEEHEPRKRHVFVKAMAYAVNGIPPHEYLPEVDVKHTFLIRNPVAVFSSFKTAIENEFEETRSTEERGDINIIDDVPIYKPKQFYRQLFNIWEDIQRKERTHPIVLDSDDVVSNPEATLQKYCREVGFQWDRKLLSWESSHNVIRRWKGSANYLRTAPSFFWFKNALSSNRFYPSNKQLPNVKQLSIDVQECIFESMPFYNELKKYKI
ncbi:hypothetical protein HOLleu_36339 [Holothuria leucospilota]|uniref:Sulfotransferase family protein n=1 Tax=Holothuria leucospilota TaxID=206669 RepID=A0A9Q0YJQ0_HOLLE|nr:hypothetical protein HOLleu_36339 [Holothuria leucospilota]